MFMDGTGGWAGWSASPGFLGCGSLSDVCPSIFVLYSNDFPSETL